MVTVRLAVDRQERWRVRTRPVMIEMTANQCSIIDVFQGNGNKSTIKSFFFVVRLFLNQSSSFIYQFVHLERKKDPTMPIIVGQGRVSRSWFNDVCIPNKNISLLLRFYFSRFCLLSASNFIIFQYQGVFWNLWEQGYNFIIMPQPR